MFNRKNLPRKTKKENLMKTNLNYRPRKRNNEMLYGMGDILPRENSIWVLNKRASSLFFFGDYKSTTEFFYYVCRSLSRLLVMDFFIKNVRRRSSFLNMIE